MLKRIVPYCLFLPVVGLFSCRKTPPKQPIYVDAVLKRYFDYQPGSYWIFYDSLNNAADSMGTSIADTFEPYSKGSSSQNEAIGINTILWGATDTLYFRFSLWNVNLSSLVIEGRNFQDEAQRFTTGIPFDTKTIPFTGPYDIGYYQCTLINDTQMNGMAYDSVYKIEWHNQSRYDSSDDVYYINRQKGFIAMSLRNQHFNKNLFLVRSFLVR